jgi:two-component system nitrate/nitrite response regulator NarP
MIRLLLADDHPIILSGLESLLRDTEFAIVGAVADGAAALAAARADPPDILLLDVRMPTLGGVEVLRLLNAEGSTVPTVLLTASLDDGNLLEAMRLGVGGIVLKEMAHAQLLECLRAVAAGGIWIDACILDRWREAAAQGKRRGPLDGLAPRERQLADMVGRGLRNRDIAAALGVSEGSVKVFLHRIYRKLKVGSRTELALLVEQAAR